MLNKLRYQFSHPNFVTPPQPHKCQNCAKPASRSVVSVIKCTNISLIRIAFEKSNCATANKNQNKLQNSRKKKRNQLNNYYFYYTRILFLSFTIMQTQTAKKKAAQKLQRNFRIN